MKIRNGFVSNSSSCSYVVEMGRKIESPKDLESILNRDFWKDTLRSGSWSEEDDRDYGGLMEALPFEAICNTIYKIMQEPLSTSGKVLLDKLEKDYGSKELVPFPRFRRRFLRKGYHKSYRIKLRSDFDEDRFEVERAIWEDYTEQYFQLKRAYRIIEMKEEAVNLVYFSFGNESDLFYLDDYRKRYSQAEVNLIYVLRNYGLANYLFKGLEWESEDYS